MNRRAFLKSLVGAAITCAAAVELLSAPKLFVLSREIAPKTSALSWIDIDVAKEIRALRRMEVERAWIEQYIAYGIEPPNFRPGGQP